MITVIVWAALAAQGITLAAGTAGANAATVHGAQPDSGNIVQVDSSTGAVVGSFAAPDALAAGDVKIGLSGAEEGTSLIYTNDDGGNPDELFRLNPVTGAVLSTETMDTWPTDGLSFQTFGSSQLIYSSDSGTDVHLQDGFSGPETFGWANNGVPLGGLGGDDAGREFGAFDDDSNSSVEEIVEYDLFDQNAPYINTLPSPDSDIQGLAFDGTNLYASDGGGSLYTLNPNTGAVLDTVSVAGGPLYGLGVLASGGPSPPPGGGADDPGGGGGADNQVPGLPAPVANQSANVVPLEGVVLIKRPGEESFTVLESAEQIPLGSELDTVNGRVEIVSASDESGGTRSAQFWGGVFAVEQADGEPKSRAPSLVTVLELAPGAGCGAREHARGRKKGNGLWGSEKGGGHSTSGNKGSGSTRGTVWFVGDTCNGKTIAKVREGKVKFRDFTLKKTITLKPGDKYVAPGKKSKKKR